MRRILLFIVCIMAAGCDGENGDGTTDAADIADLVDVTDAADTPDDLQDVQTDEAAGNEDVPLEFPTEDIPSDDGITEELPTVPEDWDRDILSTALAIDLGTLEGTATILLAPSDSTSASFEAGGLDISDVYGPEGPLLFSVADGNLHVAVPADGEVVELSVDYSFTPHGSFDGYMDSRGVTFIWPYFCGNLFPCHSEPADGLLFDLELTLEPDGRVAVFPNSIIAEAPSYQIAWALGDYTYSSIGTTDAGTEVGVWFLPGGESDAVTGTADLLAVFNWYEQTLAPYPFGSRAGSVSVDWGPGAYGGMEHHPFWHVAEGVMADPTVHAHEAAHGWFGGGVRIRCWEDFVLSEGTVSYLTARALGQVAGAAVESQIWDAYNRELNYDIAWDDGIAWPDSCGVVDILLDGLFSPIPYMKGAYFYRAVAQQITPETLDQVLSVFFTTYVGEAAGMQDMLDLIQAETGFDPRDLATAWLRSLGRPDV